MNFFITALAVFASMTLLDIAFAIYILKTAAALTFQASLWAGLIQVCNVFVVTSYVKNKWMVIPCVLGAFVGTWIAIEWVK